MIQDLIKHEVDNFLDEERKREKEREDIVRDPVLKNNGINKDYLQLVQNAIAEKNLEKAKALRDELEVLILSIKDLTAKDKAALLGVEVNNLIDLEEKIRSNKKNFELKIEENKNSDKTFFTEKKAKKAKKEIQHIFEKGIEKQASQPQNAFFTAKPDKVTVIQNIITPDQPLPSVHASSNESKEQEEDTKENSETAQQIIQQPVMAAAPPVIVQQPAARMPQEIKATLVENPKKGFEKEFGRATFFVHEIGSFIKENEWQNAKREYNTARELIESLPACEDKDKLMNQLFDDYHKIKGMEAAWKKEEEEKRKKAEEERSKLEAEEKEKRKKELAVMEEKRKERLAEAQKRELEHEIALKKMKEAAREHLSNVVEEKRREKEKTEDIAPPEVPSRLKISTHKDAQQTILEAKHEQIKTGGNNTSRFLALAQENLNHDRALKMPEERESLHEEKNYLPKDRGTKTNPDFLYKKAVSMIYEGKKTEAKTLLEHLLRVQPQNIAAQIRLKECES